MACSHLAAAPSASTAAARARSPALSQAPAFARVPATPRTTRSSPVSLSARAAFPRLIRRVVDRFYRCAASFPAGLASGVLSARAGRAASPVAFAATAAPVADLNGRPATEKQPIIVIDNYDSFTYNLCQVYTVFSFRIVLVPLFVWLLKCCWLQQIVLCTLLDNS